VADEGEGNPEALGSLIRSLRLERSYRLSDLANMTGLSVSFISQLERGLTNPSLGSLVRLADALGTTSHELLSRSSAEDGTIEYQDSHGGAYVANSGGYARSLVKGPRAIQPLEIIGGPRNPTEWAVHDSDEFMYVCDGVVQVEVENHGTFRLERGATMYYSAGVRHKWHQVGEEQVRLLLVLARPVDDTPRVPESSGSHL
jgi:transcriptional regulator with XRE-family HTH domain